MHTSTLITLLASSILPTLTHAKLPNLSGTEWTRTLFTDDFNGAQGSSPNANKWQIDTGTSYAGGPAAWGTWEVETYTSSSRNLRLNGAGNLLIIPQRDNSGAWTSGRIETKKANFMAPAGGKLRIEARIKMPNVNANNGQGYWPAFWTLGQGFRSNYSSWPAIGEYDIMENVNGLSTYNYGVHCGTNSGGVCNEPSGIGARAACGGGACWGVFHTYAVIVDRSVSPEMLTYYVDGVAQSSVSESQPGAAAWSAVVHHGHFVLLNVAMGGSYPNAVNGGTTPTSATVGGKSMAVDYVGVWTTG